MTAVVNPKAITDDERPYLGLTSAQYRALLRWLLARGLDPKLVTSMVMYLATKDPADAERVQLAHETSSTKSRTKYRRLLRELAPPIPPAGPRRRVAAERGAVVPIMAAVVTASSPAVGVAVASALRDITSPDGDGAWELAAAA